MWPLDQRVIAVYCREEKGENNCFSPLLPRSSSSQLLFSLHPIKLCSLGPGTLIEVTSGDRWLDGVLKVGLEVQRVTLSVQI